MAASPCFVWREWYVRYSHFWKVQNLKGQMWPNPIHQPSVTTFTSEDEKFVAILKSVSEIPCLCGTIRFERNPSWVIFCSPFRVSKMWEKTPCQLTRIKFKRWCTALVAGNPLESLFPKIDADADSPCDVDWLVNASTWNQKFSPGRWLCCLSRQLSPVVWRIPSVLGFFLHREYSAQCKLICLDLTRWNYQQNKWVILCSFSPCIHYR